MTTIARLNPLDVSRTIAIFVRGKAILRVLSEPALQNRLLLRCQCVTTTPRWYGQHKARRQKKNAPDSQGSSLCDSHRDNSC
jgi:hypothetical protein